MESSNSTSNFHNASCEGSTFSANPISDPTNTTTARNNRLRDFFREFWNELRFLVKELIEHNRHKSWRKKLLTIFLCVACIIVFYDLLFVGNIFSWLEGFVFWMTNHSTEAVFAFVGTFILCTLIFIPPTLLMFGAGYAFAQAIGMVHGIIAAILSCFLGSCIGAIIAFLRSRYIMRDTIHLFAKRYPLVRAADRALKRNGFRIMILLRLCPLIPFNGLNYCCGITGVSTHDFIASLVGILPFQCFTVTVGATAGTLALSSNYNGIGFGIIALVFTWKVVKKELRKELQMTPEDFDYCTDRYNQDQAGLEQGIEANYKFVENEDADEEWFWVWA